MTIDVRPAGQRFHTDIGWLDSWHSFSFSNHYDPANVGHGQLLVLNDDRVAPASGFGTHAHRDMEIVTWVLEGTLEHRDSEGNHGVLYPGLAQRMSAGSGIRHSEMNPDPDLPVHFLQMWVIPDTAGVTPGYEQLDLSERPRNCLKRAQVNTVGELLQKSEDDLLAITNFGQKSLDEVIVKLDEMGLSLRGRD